MRDEVKRLETVDPAIADDPLARQSAVEAAVESASKANGWSTGGRGGMRGRKRATATVAAINVTRERVFVDFHAEVTQVFHRELTHLEVMFRGSVLGQDIIVLPLFSSCYDGTGFEAEAVISGLQDVAAVG